MLDGYHIITLTHRQVQLGQLEGAMAPADDAEHTLRGLCSLFGWEELCYLSTCNRVMYVFYTRQPISPGLPASLLEALHPEWTPQAATEAAAPMLMMHGHDAVRHVLEVASSVDSLVLGEREIVRQFRLAYERSKDAGLSGDHLRLLMTYAIETAKQVSSRTRIGQKALSVVALAFAKMQQAGISPEARILLIGAGQTNVRFAQFLNKYGFRNVDVFNRTPDNARAIADFIGGRAHPLDALKQFSGGFDVMVVCTGATTPIISKENYSALLQGEQDPKLAIDLSIPRNIDPSLPSYYPLQVVDVEGLRAVAEAHRGFREQERERAMEIISDRLNHFSDVWHERQVERTMSPLPGQIRAFKERALNTVFARELESLDPETLNLLHRMLDYMEKKAIATPIKLVKNIALGGTPHHRTKRSVHADTP
jgi:glutamyl-tRNA reductase